MRIEKRDIPLINSIDKQLFYDLIAYTYNQRKPGIIDGLSKVINRKEISKIAKQFNFNPNSKPSELEFNDWLVIIKYILNYSSESQKGIFRGSYNRLNKQQEGIKKINRTRLDKKWNNLG